MKILVTPRSFGKTDPEIFDWMEKSGLEIVRNDTGGILTTENMAEMLMDCEGVILGVDPLNASVIDRAPQLRAVAKYGVGVDNIDLEACQKRGIKVSRTVGANSDAVADYAFTLMMAVARKLITIDARCRQGDWGKNTAIDIYGKKIGILGFGAIGRGVAQRAQGFNMDVMAYDVYWDEEYASKHNITRATPEEIYKEADFISIHVPLNEQTRGMIGKEQLTIMKPSAILINTARGGIIDEAELLIALQKNRIYGAGLDAFEEEPPKNTAWFELNNVVLGSHCAASTVGATEKMGRMAVENLIRDLDGGN